MTEEREQREHKPKFQSLVDKLQTAGIVIGLILGLRQPPAPGSEEEKRVPSWVISSFDFLTNEDEIMFNQALDAHPNTDLKTIEGDFRDRMKSDGYAENKYRSLLAGIWQKFLDQIRKPAPKDESSGRLTFGSIQLNNSCIAFFDQLIDAVQPGRSAEEIYQLQKKAADNRKLLVKKSIFHKIREHPILSLVIFISGILSLPCIFYWILYAIL